LRNGLGDHWHIADVTLKKSAKICPLWHIGQCTLAYRDVTDMPTVSPTIARSATVGELDAKS
jgi:hypothetical protein